MASIPEAVIDSVKSLGLNGSSKDANGTIGDVVVKNICCVGAGYVGESFLCPDESLAYASTVIPRRLDPGTSSR